MTITAPFAGTVTKRYANVGSMIQAGTASQSQAMPLVRLSQISTLRLSLPVPESLVPTIRVGQPVEVQVKSLGRSFEGRVARFAGKVDPSTRTMITEVDVPNPTGVILPGMYAEVSLAAKQHDDVLAAPVEAIERSGSATRVLRDRQSRSRSGSFRCNSESRMRSGPRFVSGLQDGDLVITGQPRGPERGRQGQAKAHGFRTVRRKSCQDSPSGLPTSSLLPV